MRAPFINLGAFGANDGKYIKKYYINSFVEIGDTPVIEKKAAKKSPKLKFTGIRTSTIFTKFLQIYLC